jgi:hypothetical protein
LIPGAHLPSFFSYSPACYAVAFNHAGATANADTQASIADTVIVTVFFLTNSCKLSEPIE